MQVELSYFGPAFHGWMQLPNGLPTVEGAIVEGVRALIPGSTGRSAVSSAGRTDRGVTAVAQVREGQSEELQRWGGQNEEL